MKYKIGKDEYEMVLVQNRGLLTFVVDDIKNIKKEHIISILNEIMASKIVICPKKTIYGVYPVFDRLEYDHKNKHLVLILSKEFHDLVFDSKD